MGLSGLFSPASIPTFSLALPLPFFFAGTGGVPGWASEAARFCPATIPYPARQAALPAVCFLVLSGAGVVLIRDEEEEGLGAPSSSASRSVGNRELIFSGGRKSFSLLSLLILGLLSERRNRSWCALEQYYFERERVREVRFSEECEMKYRKQGRWVLRCCWKKTASNPAGELGGDFIDRDARHFH